MKSFVVILVLAIALIIPGSVFAVSEECSTSTGAYGNTVQTCKVLGESTFVTHEVVAAGLAGVNFWMLSGILALVAGLSFGIAKLLERTYWFD